MTTEYPFIIERQWISKEEAKKIWPDEKEGTINDPKLFDRIETENGIGYKPKNYSGPIAMDATLKLPEPPKGD